MWDKFLELLTKSVIMQSLLTVLVVGAWLYLVLAGKPVPSLLETIVGVIIGFFFGSKITQNLNSIRK